MFSKFAKWMSNTLGNSLAFSIAFILIVCWLFTGPFFYFSNTWQLIINTLTTIITFLMVFLLQHTQNRDTVAIHLKLDELIRSIQGAHNALLKIEDFSDEELTILHKKYEKLANEIHQRIKKGKSDTGVPKLVDEKFKTHRYKERKNKNSNGLNGRHGLNEQRK